MPISMANPGDTVIIRRITGTDKSKESSCRTWFCGRWGSDYYQ